MVSILRRQYFGALFSVILLGGVPTRTASACPRDPDQLGRVVGAIGPAPGMFPSLGHSAPHPQSIAVRTHTEEPAADLYALRRHVQSLARVAFERGLTFDQALTFFRSELRDAARNIQKYTDRLNALPPSRERSFGVRQLEDLRQQILPSDEEWAALRQELAPRLHRHISVTTNIEDFGERLGRVAGALGEAQVRLQVPELFLARSAFLPDLLALAQGERINTSRGRVHKYVREKITTWSRGLVPDEEHINRYLNTEVDVVFREPNGRIAFGEVKSFSTPLSMNHLAIDTVLGQMRRYLTLQRALGLPDALHLFLPGGITQDCLDHLQNRFPEFKIHAPIVDGTQRPRNPSTS